MIRQARFGAALDLGDGLSRFAAQGINVGRTVECVMQMKYAPLAGGGFVGQLLGALEVALESQDQPLQARRSAVSTLTITYRYAPAAFCSHNPFAWTMQDRGDS